MSVPTDQGLLLWRYERDEDRWHERDQVCHDTRENPLRVIESVTFAPTLPVVAAVAASTGTQAIIGAMAFPGVDIKVQWDHCGFLGDGYYPAKRVLQLCYETAAVPALSRYAAAHEMSHAIIRQLNLPVMGNEEQMADDMASVTLILLGHSQDVWDVAQGFNNLAQVSPVYWSDTHPPHAHRAREMRCLVYGSRGEEWLDFYCVDEWRIKLRSWVQLLGDK